MPALIIFFESLLFLLVNDKKVSSLNSYKQFDPSPRYHARDSSIVLASLHNAKVILGSATIFRDNFNRWIINLINR